MSQQPEHEVDLKRLVLFLERSISVLSDRYTSQESNRLTLVYFAVSALDLIDRLDLIQHRKTAIIDFIYSLQVLPDQGGTSQSGLSQADATIKSQLQYLQYQQVPMPAVVASVARL
jgi:prenyltransferase beta subunit